MKKKNQQWDGQVFSNAEKDMDEQFAEYDPKHPDIWVRFEALANETLACGATYYSGGIILFLIRHHYIVSNPRDPFKVNQNFASRYVRKWDAKYPDYPKFFKKKKLKSRAATAAKEAAIAAMTSDVEPEPELVS